MELNIKKFTIKDLIAIITLVIGFILIAKGIDGIVGMLMIAIIGFYFGHFRKNSKETHV